MTYLDRVEQAPSVPFKVAPGVFEVDFENFDPDNRNGWLDAWKRPEVLLPKAPLADLNVSGPGQIYPELYPGTYPAPPAPAAEPEPSIDEAVTPEWVCRDPLEPRTKQRQNWSKGRPHCGMLRGEVRSLYNAMSFKTLRDGRGFDTLITVTAKYLGVEDEAKFARLLPVMNKAAADWLGNGNDRFRVRRSRRCRMTKSREHTYIYVLEKGSTHGLHVHQLSSVPPELQADFRAWLGRWWEKKVGHAFPENAINVKYAHMCGEWGQYEKQQFWFRYLIKAIDPGLEVVSRRTYERRSAVSVFKPIWRWKTKPKVFLPIGCRQIYGISQNLNTAAQEEFGFRSKFDQGRLDELYTGSEIKAWVTWRHCGSDDWWQWF